MSINSLMFIYYGNGKAPDFWESYFDKMHCNRLYYVKNGNARYTDDAGVHPLKKGFLYFLPKNANYIPEQDSENRIDHLFFDFICVPMPCATHVIEIDPKNDPIILASINILSHYVSRAPFYTEDSERYKPLVTLQFTLLLEHLRQEYDVEFLSYSPLQDAIQYMLEHFAEPLTVNELARRAGYNPKYFIKIFTEAMYVTPYQFLRNLRLNRALMLINEGASISQAASNVGFQYPASLTNALKARRKKNDAKKDDADI